MHSDLPNDPWAANAVLKMSRDYWLEAEKEALMAPTTSTEELKVDQARRVVAFRDAVAAKLDVRAHASLKLAKDPSAEIGETDWRSRKGARWWLLSSLKLTVIHQRSSDRRVYQKKTDFGCEIERVLDLRGEQT
jgi:hypothetical protein